MNSWIKHSCLVVLGLMGLKSTAAFAAVDMSLCIDGEAGSVSDSKSDAGCIDVLAWSWGASNSGSVVSPGKTNFQDISFTKYQDNESTYLLQKVANGSFLPQWQLRVREACGLPDCVGNMTARYTVAGGSLVSSVSTGGSGGEDRLTENISINLPSIEWCYAARNAAGTVVTPVNLVCAQAIIASPP